MRLARQWVIKMNKKVIIGLVILVGIVVIAIVYFKTRKTSATSTTTEKSTTSTTIPTATKTTTTPVSLPVVKTLDSGKVAVVTGTNTGITANKATNAKYSIGNKWAFSFETAVVYTVTGYTTAANGAQYYFKDAKGNTYTAYVIDVDNASVKVV